MRTNGINHLALVCRDMEETVKFYTQVLDMPLVKTVALPDGGQHFFFDCGGGSLLAFFWWENAPAAAPGVAGLGVELAERGLDRRHVAAVAVQEVDARKPMMGQ